MNEATTTWARAVTELPLADAKRVLDLGWEVITIGYYLML